MADIKPQVYKDPRPAEYFTRFHEHVRAHPPGWIYELVRLITTWIAILHLPRAGDQYPEPARRRPRDRRAEPLLEHGPLLRRRLLRRKMQFMAKSQLFGNPILNYIFRIGGVFPMRRGHRDEEAFMTAPRDPRPRQLRAHVLRGWPLAHRGARRGQARSRPARARDRSPGGPGGHPRLARGAQVAQAPLPEGHGAIRRADHLPGRRRPRRRSSSSRPQRRVFETVKEMYAALDEQGRSGVLKSLKSPRLPIRGSSEGV